MPYYQELLIQYCDKIRKKTLEISQGSESDTLR